MRAWAALPLGLILCGIARAEGDAAADASGRILVRSRTAWLWSEPTTAARRLGYARGGTTLSLGPDEPKPGRGCRGRFFPVSPRGWLCEDDTAAGVSDRRFRVERLLGESRPFRYVISNGVPLYRRLPTRAEWEHAESDLGRPGEFKRYPWNEKHERLAEQRPIEPKGRVPFFLENGGSARAEREDELVFVLAPLGTMLAYVNAFEHAGRTWLLTTDGHAVPAERVRPYRASHFQGVELSGRTALPLAWPRPEAATRYRLSPDGRALAPSGHWSARVPIALDADVQPRVVAGKRLLATHDVAAGDAPLWVEASEVAVARPEPRPARVGPSEKWIVVHVREGTLTAYEGDRPVFATLVSPGAGGVSRDGVDPVKASTTPRGSYRIQYKYRSQTMSPQKDKPSSERTFWIAEVPHAQYFDIPFALHTAYWHESFGEWMSGGCVNLSPTDGAWMFGWTEPAAPQGWDAVWAGGDNGRGTVVVVAR